MDAKVKSMALASNAPYVLILTCVVDVKHVVSILDMSCYGFEFLAPDSDTIMGSIIMEVSLLNFLSKQFSETFSVLLAKLAHLHSHSVPIADSDSELAVDEHHRLLKQTLILNL